MPEAGECPPRLGEPNRGDGAVWALDWLVLLMKGMLRLSGNWHPWEGQSPPALQDPKLSQYQNDRK